MVCLYHLVHQVLRNCTIRYTIARFDALPAARAGAAPEAGQSDTPHRLFRRRCRTPALAVRAWH